MAEYKSRRERRHAQGGKGQAPKGVALIIGIAPKEKPKKIGGWVEGEKAKRHLGKRARGGRLAHQLDAREAAFNSDGLDKVAKGLGSDEREVPMRKRGGRAEGGATKSKFEVDDNSSKDMGDLAPKREGPPSKYTTDDGEPEKKASGGPTVRTPPYTGDHTVDNRIDPSPATADRNEIKQMPSRDRREEALAKGGWIGPARERMEKKGTVGSLHKALHIPEGGKIPEKRLESASKHASPKLAKKIQFAENVRK